MFRTTGKRGLIAAFIAAGLLVTVAPAVAHELLRNVTAGEAIVIRFYYADETAFSYESYEVFREGDDIPFQVGRTDALGQLVFVPDRTGSWRVRVFSEDGHGADFTVEAGAPGQVEAVEKSPFDRYTRLIVGIAVILGLFGVLRLYILRSARGSGGKST